MIRFAFPTQRRGISSLLLVLAVSASSCQSDAPQASTEPTSGIQGAWAAQTYTLASGPTHPVAGHIFFTDRDWQVLFFVLDADGHPRRGSGEGGAYRLQGDSLTLTHLFNLSAGDAMEGLPHSELGMIVRAESDAPEEPTRVEVADHRLVLYFPSGNRMAFARR